LAQWTDCAVQKIIHVSGSVSVFDRCELFIIAVKLMDELICKHLFEEFMTMTWSL